MRYPALAECESWHTYTVHSCRQKYIWINSRACLSTPGDFGTLEWQTTACKLREACHFEPLEYHRSYTKSTGEHGPLLRLEPNKSTYLRVDQSHLIWRGTSFTSQFPGKPFWQKQLGKHARSIQIIFNNVAQGHRLSGMIDKWQRMLGPSVEMGGCGEGNAAVLAEKDTDEIMDFVLTRNQKRHVF